MRRTLLVGLALVVGAVLAVFISSWFDLELEPVVLLGVALGAVIALVPDRSPLMRLAGFAGGFVAAWIGYFLRAAVLPDSTGGRAVAVGLVLILVVAVAAVSLERIPLWSTLVGAAALAGAYEYTYAAAPPEVASTSVSTATALLLTAAIGYLATALAVPAEGRPAGGARRTR
ncbi:MAG: hypothetical protein LPK36_05265, partial [Actinomycetes bacterium]|nr:hypothetical protein [Actinomycetes bacterium]